MMYLAKLVLKYDCELKLRSLENQRIKTLLLRVTEIPLDRWSYEVDEWSQGEVVFNAVSDKGYKIRLSGSRGFYGDPGECCLWIDGEIVASTYSPYWCSGPRTVWDYLYGIFSPSITKIRNTKQAKQNEAMKKTEQERLKKHIDKL